MNHAKKGFVTTIIVSCALVTTACADDPNRRTKIGAATGAVIGAAIGNHTDKGKGKYAGAVVGAIAGGAVGHYMDEQQKKLEQDLAREAARNELSIVRMSEDTLRVGVASDVSFDVGSAVIKLNARQTYDKIAAVLKDYDHTVIHVVGHTDSDGSDPYNQTLSEQRGEAVTGVLASDGVPSSRLRTEGRGEREPTASNATADGKRRNRRVDIVIKTVVEGREQDAERAPPYLGS